jgi:hypothetical protein
MWPIEVRAEGAKSGPQGGGAAYHAELEQSRFNADAPAKTGHGPAGVLFEENCPEPTGARHYEDQPSHVSFMPTFIVVIVDIPQAGLSGATFLTTIAAVCMPIFRLLDR